MRAPSCVTEGPDLCHRTARDDTIRDPRWHNSEPYDTIRGPDDHPWPRIASSRAIGSPSCVIKGPSMTQLRALDDTSMTQFGALIEGPEWSSRGGGGGNGVTEDCCNTALRTKPPPSNTKEASQHLFLNNTDAKAILLKYKIVSKDVLECSVCVRRWRFGAPL
jgi:hypothetical protein